MISRNASDLPERIPLHDCRIILMQILSDDRLHL